MKQADFGRAHRREYRRKVQLCLEVFETMLFYIAMWSPAAATAIVAGLVAGIVKLDDFGIHLSRSASAGLAAVGHHQIAVEIGATVFLVVEVEHETLHNLIEQLQGMDPRSYAAMAAAEGTVEVVLETFSVRLKQEGFTLDYAPPPVPVRL